MKNIVGGMSFNYTVMQTDNFFIAFGNSLFPNAVAPTVINNVNDAIHCDVTKFSREVTGVRSLEGSVSEALSGTVGGDEILQNRQPLPEGRENGPFNDFTRRLGH